MQDPIFLPIIVASGQTSRGEAGRRGRRPPPGFRSILENIEAIHDVKKREAGDIRLDQN